MTTETSTDSSAELIAIAKRIRDLQKGRLDDISDAAMCKRFGQLGSTKTYTRILAGDLDQMNVERQLQNYKTALAFVESAASNDDPLEDQLYDDLNDPTRVRIAVSEAMLEKDNTRLVLVGGESGDGKTSIKQILQSRWPKIVCAVEADESWKESQPTFLADMLLALNPIERGEERQDGEEPVKTRSKTDEVEIPYSPFERKHKLLRLLARRKLVLIIDEAHHIGVRNFNFIKTIINRTDCVVVLFFHPVLFKQFELKSFLETSQLTQNRLYERIRLAGPTGVEVATFFDRRKVKFADPKDTKPCSEKLAAESKGRGSWKFVKLVTRRLRKASAKTPIDQEQFIESLNAVLKTR